MENQSRIEVVPHGTIKFAMDDTPGKRFSQSDIDANQNACTMCGKTFSKGDKGDPVHGKLVWIEYNADGHCWGSVVYTGQVIFKYSGVTPTAMSTLVDVDGNGCVIQSDRKPVGGCLERGLVLEVNPEDNICIVVL